MSQSGGTGHYATVSDHVTTEECEMCEEGRGGSEGEERGVVEEGTGLEVE